MKKSFLLIILLAIMTLGLLSCSVSAESLAQEGSRLYQAGTYRFVPSQSGLYTVQKKYTYSSAYYDLLDDSYGIGCLYLKKGRSYYLNVFADNAEITIRNITPTEKMTQGQCNYNLLGEQFVTYQLDVSNSADDFHFEASGQGDTRLYIFKTDGTAVENTEGDDDDWGTGYNFNATYHLSTGHYYIAVMAYEDDTYGTMTMYHDKHAINTYTAADGSYEKKCIICGLITESVNNGSGGSSEGSTEEDPTGGSSATTTRREDPTEGSSATTTRREDPTEGSSSSEEDGVSVGVGTTTSTASSETTTNTGSTVGVHNSGNTGFTGNTVAQGMPAPNMPWLVCKNTAKKTMTVWISPSQYAMQYQIQYATKKNFKKAKNIYTVSCLNNIKKLKKKKTYYVRVRALNNVGISAWSPIRKIKIKK